VHAARSIVTAKLLVPVEPTPAAEALARGQRGHYDGSAMTRVALGGLESLRSSINAHLPPDVRCWGVAVTPGSFRAREGCSWREYEYVFPASVLDDDDEIGSSSGSDSSSREEAVTQSAATGEAAKRAARRAARLVALQGALSQFEGVHTWHNFTKASALLLGGGNNHHRDDPGLQSDADHGGEHVGERTFPTTLTRSQPLPQSPSLSPSTPSASASSSPSVLSDNDLFAALDQGDVSGNGLDEEVDSEKNHEGTADEDDDEDSGGLSSPESIQEWATKELAFQAYRDQTKEKMMSSGPAVFRIIHKCFVIDEPMVVNGAFD